MALPLHIHLVRSIARALEDIFFHKKYADKIIEKCFKENKKWGSRDRKFFAETVYEIVRHKRRLEYVANSTEPWSLIAAYLFQISGELPYWDEFSEIDLSAFNKRNSAEKPPEVANSFPDWMHQLGKEEFKDQWNALMNSLNKPAEVYLRVNTLKADLNTVAEELRTEEINCEKINDKKFELPSCLKLSKRKNVFITKSFRAGHFEVQDAGSQLIAPLLQLESGMRVVDACAGAGGKSLHMASLMKNKGKIISMDIHEWKLKELKIRAARNSVDIIETKVIESAKTIKRLEKSFDRVLLDVPCSGMGVLRRNPDTKWKLQPEELQNLQQTQREILESYSKMCKIGGLMVYATCSILQSENEMQIQNFLNTDAGKGWDLIQQTRVWPHVDGYDGFFAAVLKRF